MKELKLGLNFSFYVMLSLTAFCLLLSESWLYPDSAQGISKLQQLIALAILGYVLIALGTFIFGRRQFRICSQGVAYRNLFGQQCYLPAEQIRAISAKQIYCFNYTEVSLKERNIRFWSFKLRPSQLERLKLLGY
ncbi:MULTISPECIES: hypothetical protein [unclassified Pseudoalteromonas]|uniref:hypothetical protein n=1 Tax=unclassified Pseudoalteromonas TaxID=194690 RepID=UPI0030145785